MSEKPETEAVVKEKLSALHAMWEELESTTQTKAQCLFDANKAELFTQSCADLDKWLGGLEGQIQSDDYGKDLTSVNILLKKQQVLWNCIVFAVVLVLHQKQSHHCSGQYYGSIGSFRKFLSFMSRLPADAGEPGGGASKGGGGAAEPSPGSGSGGEGHRGGGWEEAGGGA